MTKNEHTRADGARNISETVRRNALTHIVLLTEKLNAEIAEDGNMSYDTIVKLARNVEKLLGAYYMQTTLDHVFEED